jgi:hypothetical protein
VQAKDVATIQTDLRFEPNSAQKAGPAYADCCAKKEGRIDLRRLPSLIWLAVLLACLFQVQVDAFAQLLAWFEMRNVLARQCHSIAGFGITTHPRRPMMQRKAAKTAHLDTLTMSQCMAHLFDHALDGHLDVSERKVGLAPGQRLDQFGFSHGAPMSVT